jgi:pimeloyl-ACP methyl ester carboxylesterase
MTTYVLVPGAGSRPWYWHRVVPLLRAGGSGTITPDLPCSDDSAGLDRYVQTVLDAIGDQADLVLVGQSMGALTATLVAERVRPRRLVLLSPIIPAPGERPADYWSNTAQGAAMHRAAASDGRTASWDPVDLFLHDVPLDIAAASAHHVSPQSDRPFADVWPLERWPDVPTRVIAGRYDRLFPLPYLQQVARERLGIEPDVLPSGHLPALACPEALVARLEAYETEQADLEDVVPVHEQHREQAESRG